MEMNHETHEKHEIEPSRGELLVYSGPDGEMKLDVRLQDETVWLSINQMANLFGVDKSGISRHLKNVFESGELLRESVVAKFATTATDGKTYQVEYFNLDAIISVGYRVNTRYPVPDLGDRAAQRVHCQGLYSERPAPQRRGQQPLFRGAAGPHPRYSLFRKGVLAQGVGYLRHQH